jgi:hypothetical protein
MAPREPPATWREGEQASERHQELFLPSQATIIEEFKHRDRNGYEELPRQPGFLCVRAVKHVC